MMRWLLLTMSSVLLVVSSYAAPSRQVNGSSLVLVEEGLSRAPIVVYKDAPLLTRQSADELAQTIAHFHLRFIVFFGCAFLFVKSFRGEVLQHTLHLTFLLPLRRADVIKGKYFGALAVSLSVLLPATVALFVGYHLANGVGTTLKVLTSPLGIAHLGAYLGATSMAAVGYGALFLLAGLFFRNPMIPAALYLGFEALGPYLPLPIRIFSIARHLAALLPVPVSLGPVAVSGNDTPGWLSIVLILFVAGTAVHLAGRLARAFEVDYS